MKSLLTQRVEKECKLLFTLQWRPDYKCMAAGCLMYLVIWHPAHSMVRHSWQSSLKASPSNVKTLFQPRSPPSVWPNFDDSGYISRSYVLATSPPPPQIYVSVGVGGWVSGPEKHFLFCHFNSPLVPSKYRKPTSKYFCVSGCDTSRQNKKSNKPAWQL